MLPWTIFSMDYNSVNCFRRAFRYLPRDFQLSNSTRKYLEAAWMLIYEDCFLKFFVCVCIKTGNNYLVLFWSEPVVEAPPQLSVQCWPQTVRRLRHTCYARMVNGSRLSDETLFASVIKATHKWHYSVIPRVSRPINPMVPLNNQCRWRKRGSPSDD